MSTSAAPGEPEPGQDAGLDEIENAIEHDREKLGETVEALSEKLDVKAQARKKTEALKTDAAQSIREAKEHAMDAAAVVGSRARSFASQGSAPSSIDDDRRIGTLVAGAFMMLAGAAVVLAVVWVRRQRNSRPPVVQQRRRTGLPDRRRN